MSNATQDSRNSGGDSRRRRSRGGQNRNNNQNNQENRRGGGDRERRSGDNRGQSQGRRQEGNRAEEFRPQAPRPARVYSAPKLSFWQKILKAVGLYKEPARPERKEEPARQGGEARAPKSNTRVARTHEGPAREREPRAEREPAGERTRSERQPRERTRGGNRDSLESPRVYVGNLSYDVSEQDLQELFKGIGGVRNVEIVYNRSTHRSKGYGFVEMLHMDEAIRAVEVLNDQHFMGRKLTVSGAKSKGNDEREEIEDRPERAQPPVVVASANPTGISAEVAEPQIETIVENVVETAAPSEEPAPAAAVDLEARYGFEPKEKTEEA
ncbi:MAG: RNA-binding protein [Akkermansiaceae bacterium]